MLGIAIWRLVVRVLAVVAGLWLATSTSRATLRQPPDPSWRLIWADEFDGAGPPDPRHWTFETGFVRNQEAQWYQETNAFRRDGRLVIEARHERVKNSRHVPGSSDWRTARTHADYTSASMTTRALHAWQYGRFEMRARIDTRDGLWPAFWTLGVEGEWPDNGEIDIMESYRGFLLANVAWTSGRRWVPTWDDARIPIASLGSGWADAFHVWRMDWDARRIVLSVDGRELNATDLDGIPGGPRGPAHPFRQPHYLLLNLAIGGQNGGDPSKTTFPARLEVDWIRVSQQETLAGAGKPPAESFSGRAHDSSGAGR